jgi:hypothetical protein
MNVMSSSTTERLDEIFGALEEVLRAHPAHQENDFAIATDTDARELFAQYVDDRDLQYLTSLAVVGVGTLSRAMLKTLQGRLFEIEERVSTALDLSRLQLEIIEHNIRASNLSLPEEFSQRADFLLNRKGAAQ